MYVFLWEAFKKLIKSNKNRGTKIITQYLKFIFPSFKYLQNSHQILETKVNAKSISFEMGLSGILPSYILNIK